MLDTALIFAAGRGQRLMPLTANLPKPMLCLQGKPLLAYHLENLAQQGFKRVIINHAYLGDKIKAYLGTGPHFGLTLEYFAEPPGGLETGGTLAAIMRCCSLTSTLLLTVNGDIITDYRFNPKLQLEDKANAHLILIPASTALDNRPDFYLNPQGIIALQPKTLIFSGIAYYRCAALHQLPLGRYSIRDWLFSQSKQQQLCGELFQGRWLDIGSPKRWQDAQTYFV